MTDTPDLSGDAITVDNTTAVVTDTSITIGGQ